MLASRAYFLCDAALTAAPWRRELASCGGRGTYLSVGCFVCFFCVCLFPLWFVLAGDFLRSLEYIIHTLSNEPHWGVRVRCSRILGPHAPCKLMYTLWKHCARCRASDCRLCQIDLSSVRLLFTKSAASFVLCGAPTRAVFS